MRPGKLLFWPYLDGALTGTQMRTSLSAHMGECLDCEREYASLRAGAAIARENGSAKSTCGRWAGIAGGNAREIAKSKRDYFQGVLVRFENTLNALGFGHRGLISAIVDFWIANGLLGIAG